MAYQETDELVDLILERLPDNAEELITPADLRLILTSMVGASFIKKTDTLSVNQLRGGVHLKANLAARDLISPGLRVVGMGCVVFNPVNKVEAQAGVVKPEQTFVLVKDSAGPVTALINAEPLTTTTTNARWVLASGSDEDKIASFPVIVPTNQYRKDDVGQYTVQTGQTRLFKARKDLLSTTFNAPPTGQENDPNWIPFSPLTSGVTREQLSDVLMFTLKVAEVRDYAADAELPQGCTIRVTGRVSSGGQALPNVIVPVATNRALAAAEAYLENTLTSLQPCTYDLATDQTSARPGGSVEAFVNVTLAGNVLTYTRANAGVLTITLPDVVELSAEFNTPGSGVAYLKINQTRKVGFLNYASSANVADVAVKKNGVAANLNGFAVVLNDVVTVTGNAGPNGGSVLFNVTK